MFRVRKNKLTFRAGGSDVAFGRTVSSLLKCDVLRSKGFKDTDDKLLEGLRSPSINSEDFLPTKTYTVLISYQCSIG